MLLYASMGWFFCISSSVTYWPTSSGLGRRDWVCLTVRADRICANFSVEDPCCTTLEDCCIHFGSWVEVFLAGESHFASVTSHVKGSVLASNSERRHNFMPTRSIAFHSVMTESSLSKETNWSVPLSSSLIIIIYIYINWLKNKIFDKEIFDISENLTNGR
jgi:hypothetical protein